MINSSKLPQKSKQVLAHYKSLNKVSKRFDTDTSTVTSTIISSSHIFNP